MKILREGKVKGYKIWWVGKVSTCPNCNSKVRFDNLDIVVGAISYNKEDMSITYTCPNFECEQKIKIQRPPPKEKK